MKIVLRALGTTLVLLSVACGGGSSGDSGGNAANPALANLNDGSYAGIDTFLTNIRVVDLNTNTPPSDDDCRGNIDVVIDGNAADVIIGSGQCSLVASANNATYTLVGGFVNGNDFEGRITIVFSGVTHVLDFSGSINGNTLDATFQGRTPQTARLVIDWNGSFSAVRP